MLRKVFNRLVLGLLPLLLAACATVSTAGPSPQSIYAGTVAAYTAALTAVTPLRVAGKLSAGQIGALNTLNALLVPIVKGPIPSNPTQDIALLEKGIAELAAMKQHPGA